MKLFVAFVGDDLFGVFSSRDRAVAALEISASWRTLKRATEKAHHEAFGPTVPAPPLEHDIEEVTLDVPLPP